MRVPVVIFNDDALWERWRAAGGDEFFADRGAKLPTATREESNACVRAFAERMAKDMGVEIIEVVANDEIVDHLLRQ